MNELKEEISKRLTFAIISHPDAGKTTITEKLLLFGGAIHIAGSVKSKKSSRQTTSDFMSMEQDRGISISTSVMGFNYRGRIINLLDTPGHADFSEDTYRGLSAVDSSLIVIDSVKGVEERTRKLCEVCRMRRTPITTFINKMDREGKNPMELLDEVERELSIQVRPVSWPIGQGQNFKGVYNLVEKRFIRFRPGEDRRPTDIVCLDQLEDEKLDQLVGGWAADRLREDIALLEEIYPPLDKEEYLSGKVTPVFFGSALNNFGVQELLDNLIAFAPSPTAKEADEREVLPYEDKLTGFIFKIHANLNPKHRDRIAFLRICSGRFERNKIYRHVRTGKTFRSPNPTAFMAQSREIIDEAWAGDIIGLHDTGTFAIGDTITEGEALNFKGIPSFAPQIFQIIRNSNPDKEKQFHKGLNQLAEEGVIQIFSKLTNPNTRVLGVVGRLQLDVLQSRLESEYGASCSYTPMEFTLARWVSASSAKKLKTFIDKNHTKILVDARGAHVVLADTEWSLNRLISINPDILFYSTSDTALASARVQPVSS
jgi:peptide chain release factor 3